MASEGQTQAFGQYIEAEEALGESPEAEEGESEEESADETEDETESETETESESGTESDSESETGSESESESQTETEAETTETERSTATGTGDGKSPRPQKPVPADEGTQLPPQIPAGYPADVADAPGAVDEADSADAADAVDTADTEGAVDAAGWVDAPDSVDAADAADASESLANTQQDDDAQLPSMEPEGAPMGHAPCLLPPATSRRASRESTSPHHTPRAEDARTSTAESLVDGQGEAATFSLPPAVSRNNSRECSRKSSHLEASTSGSILRRSSGSLPPINQRGGSQQPSRKGSSSSSQAAGKRSQASSPKQGSPSRNPNAAPRYYQPPPPPPPPPKPKPRERHDTSAVDPMFLQTAVYRTVPNVGRVYDWKLQHEVNTALSKQRKQQVQMEKVLEAARVQLQVKDANERAFQQWVAAKEQEKQQQYQQNRRIAYVTSVYQNLLKDDPVERKAREALWVSNFACRSSEGTPPRLMPRERVSEDAERFRL